MYFYYAILKDIFFRHWNNSLVCVTYVTTVERFGQIVFSRLFLLARDDAELRGRCQEEKEKLSHGNHYGRRISITPNSKPHHKDNDMTPIILVQSPID